MITCMYHVDLWIAFDSSVSADERYDCKDAMGDALFAAASDYNATEEEFCTYQPSFHAQFSTYEDAVKFEADAIAILKEWLAHLTPP